MEIEYAVLQKKKTPIHKTVKFLFHESSILRVTTFGLDFWELLVCSFHFITAFRI